MQKPKAVPGNYAYAGTLKEGRNFLLTGDSHFRRVKRGQTTKLIRSKKSFIRYFSGGNNHANKLITMLCFTYGEE